MNQALKDRAKEVALEQLVRVLDRVPLVSSVKNDLTGLRSLLYRRRPPRIAALGLAGSGRSTLLRSLIERRPARDPLQPEHGQWVQLEHEGAKVDWLEIDLNDRDARAQWKHSLEKETPDRVFLSFEPRNASDAKRIIERAKSLLPDVPEGIAALRVFTLMTHADLIGRGDADVEAARNELEAKIRDSGLSADPPRAVSAISGYGLEGLSEAMVLALPVEARLEAHVVIPGSSCVASQAGVARLGVSVDSRAPRHLAGGGGTEHGIGSGMRSHAPLAELEAHFGAGVALRATHRAGESGLAGAEQGFRLAAPCRRLDRRVLGPRVSDGLEGLLEVVGLT